MDRSGESINRFTFMLNRFRKLKLRTKIMLAILVVLLTWFWFCLPAKLFNAPTSFILEDKSGNLLDASIAADGQWRFPYDENVPDKFIKCILTFEDKRFYHHPGVDPFAFVRALLKNIKGKGPTQGGSTITMQVIRLSRDKQQRNLWQKLIESIIAVRLECSYSKKSIMALYASNAPFGGNVVGLDAAAWRYYGQSPDKLSWGEMAVLAVLPNSPALVNPGKNRNVLLKKRNELLDKLVTSSIIDSTTAALAKTEPLPGAPLPLPQYAPHLLQRFKNDAAQTDSNTTTKIKTTVDLELQKNVINILEQHHNGLRGNGINNTCALVLDVETGNVLSYVGNIYDLQDTSTESYVDVIKAGRSPGSTLKPILYAAAMNDGMILPNSILPDIPTQINGYVLQNFDMDFAGAVPASKALSRSLNVPAVKLLQQYKVHRFYDLLKRCGITTLNKPADSYGLSLILGGCDISMWDLAGVYASLARTLKHQDKNNGRSITKDFHPPQYQINKTENDIDQPDSIFGSFDAASIWLTFEAMQEVRRPSDEGVWEQFASSQRVAWKTGTSFGFRDAWAIGITPKYVVAVWVGNADGEGRPGLVGVETAAPIMFDIFRQLPSCDWFKMPRNNFIRVPVCRQSGYRASMDCPDVDTVWAPQNGFKVPLCSYHKIIHLDPTGTFRVNENCTSPSNMISKSWYVLTPTMEWYYKQKNQDYKLLPPFKAGCGYEDNGKNMDLIYPQNNEKIYVPIEINGEQGKTVFTATHRKANAKIYWSLDDEYLTTTERFHQIAISPPPGVHIITIVDDNGESISRQFEIMAKGR
jgi:penicillin-binding protein 1C